MNLRKICKEAGYELVIALTGDQVTCTKWRGLRSETDGDYFKKQQRFFETLASTQAIIMALK